jgi:hypothetical protein
VQRVNRGKGSKIHCSCVQRAVFTQGCRAIICVSRLERASSGANRSVCYLAKRDCSPFRRTVRRFRHFEEFNWHTALKFVALVYSVLCLRKVVALSFASRDSGEQVAARPAPCVISRNAIVLRFARITLAIIELLIFMINDARLSLS